MHPTAFLHPATVDEIAEPTATAPPKPFKMTTEDLRSNPPTLMNEGEVATFLGICPRSVRNFTVRGLLPVIRLGRRRLFRRDAVLAAIAKLETSARS